jgi:hypothetical protein
MGYCAIQFAGHSIFLVAVEGIIVLAVKTRPLFHFYHLKNRLSGGYRFIHFIRMGYNKKERKILFRNERLKEK